MLKGENVAGLNPKGVLTKVTLGPFLMNEFCSEFILVLSSIILLFSILVHFPNASDFNFRTLHEAKPPSRAARSLRSYA